MSLITQCCYCKRVKMTADRWSDEPIKLDSNLRNVTHGACPACFEAQLKALERDLGAPQHVVRNEVLS